MNKAYPNGPSSNSAQSSQTNKNQVPQQASGSLRIGGGLPVPNGDMQNRDALRQEAAKRNAGVASAKSRIPQKQVDPIRFWDDYYADPKSNDDPDDLLGLVALLRVDKKFRDIEGVLRGYLRHHSDLAEVWMYDTLGIAIEVNKGDMAEVKSLVGFAAHLARSSDNPNDLFQVADMLLLRNWFLPVGAEGYKANLPEILDRLIEKVPHRLEPYLMEVLLAERTKNPGRMGDAAEGILSLGWPGQDAGVRLQIRSRCDAMAKQLRDEGRPEEAKAMLDRVTNATVRDLVVKLKWKGVADLDLVVEEPLGAKANYDMPRTVFGGSLISNGRSTDPAKSAEEMYVCPRGFDGTYTISVQTVYNAPEDPRQAVKTAEVEVIMHEGTSQEKKQSFTVNLDPESIKPVQIALEGGRRVKVLPFVGPQKSPELPKNLKKAIAGNNPKESEKPGVNVIGGGGSRTSTPKKEPSKAIVVPDYQPKSTKAIDLTNPKSK